MTLLPSGIYPEVEFPRIVAVAQSGDLSPRLMMIAVTRPLEEARARVLGVRRVRSGRSAARRSFPSSSIRTPTCRTPCS
jgi:multidrug efflux pump subunit AcrB